MQLLCNNCHCRAKYNAHRALEFGGNGLILIPAIFYFAEQL